MNILSIYLWGGKTSKIVDFFWILQVARIQPYGVFVKVPGYKKNGLVHKSQISQTHVEDASDVLDVGEEVYCKVISIEVRKIKCHLHNYVKSILDCIFSTSYNKASVIILQWKSESYLHSSDAPISNWRLPLLRIVKRYTFVTSL